MVYGIKYMLYTNVRILHPGSKAQDVRDSRNTLFGIPLFMWPFGSHKDVVLRGLARPSTMQTQGDALNLYDAMLKKGPPTST